MTANRRIGLDITQLLQALEASGGRVTSAAARLGCDPTTIHYHLKRHCIRLPIYALSKVGEHSPVALAAARLQELRQRAVVIRDSHRISPQEKERQRRILAGELAQATLRYRALIKGGGDSA